MLSGDVRGTLRATTVDARAASACSPSGVRLAFSLVRRRESSAFRETYRCEQVRLGLQLWLDAHTSSSSFRASRSSRCITVRSSSALSFAIDSSRNTLSVSSFRSKVGTERPEYLYESHESMCAQSCACARCCRALEGEKRSDGVRLSIVVYVVYWFRKSICRVGRARGELRLK
jgi:hypothetical protein